MTPRQFIQDFLKVSEQDYPFLEINPKLMEDLLQAWEAKIVFEKVWGEDTLTKGQPMFHPPTTSDTNVEYLTIEQIVNKYPLITPKQMDEINNIVNDTKAQYGEIKIKPPTATMFFNEKECTWNYEKKIWEISLGDNPLVMGSSIDSEGNGLIDAIEPKKWNIGADLDTPQDTNP